jgi:lysophospholipase L1-like esterase
MPVNKIMTRFITIGALLLTLLFIFNFIWSVQDFYSGKAEGIRPETKVVENSKKQTGDMTIVALGDSLTRGTGDDTGKGYVGLVSDEIKKRLSPHKVTLYNLGIKGQTSTQLLQQLGQQQIGRQISEADVILLTIGGNDLFQKGETLLNFNPEEVQKIQQQYLSNLQQIFTTIRSKNEGATILLLGLYNPFIELENSDMTNTLIREWNNGTEEVTSEFNQIVFVPTFDLFQLSVNDYLYSDNFHPNQLGYQLISDRVIPLISLEKEGN